MQAGVLRLVHYGYGQQSDSLGFWPAGPPAPFTLSANSVTHMHPSASLHLASNPPRFGRSVF